eukprot:355739-Chlamydomonas_euryale.AAC.5
MITSRPFGGKHLQVGKANVHMDRFLYMHAIMYTRQLCCHELADRGRGQGPGHARLPASQITRGHGCTNTGVWICRPRSGSRFK